MNSAASSPLGAIQINGKQLRIIHYSAPLWRADYTFMRTGVNARTNYAGAKYKYFTLTKEELAGYTYRGMVHMKKWMPRRPLVLVLMMDPNTRQSMADLVGDTTDIDIAFPLNSTGTPYRVSEEDTKQHDDAFLEQLCALGLDGYYMERQGRRPGVGKFHSEVGLCASTFKDLALVEIDKAMSAPAMKRGNTRRWKGNNNNNKNKNNSRPVKRSRLNMNNTIKVQRKPLFSYNSD